MLRHLGRGGFGAMAGARHNKPARQTGGDANDNAGDQHHGVLRQALTEADRTMHKCDAQGIEFLRYLPEARRQRGERVGN